MEMEIVGCTKEFVQIYCTDCNKSSDPGTCLNYRIHEKRKSLIKQSNGEIVEF
jgi:hypothetical protein